MCFVHRFLQGMSGDCVSLFIADMTCLYCLIERIDAEEQMQHPSYCAKKDTYASVIVIFFLRICFWDCNVLIFRTPRKRKQPKETNWKQKIQKLQNENICLTCLNVENNGNFPILSFSWVLYGAKNVRWNLIFCSTIRFIYCISWKRICEKWTFHVALYSIFKENTHVFITFFE